MSESSQDETTVQFLSRQVCDEVRRVLAEELAKLPGIVEKCLAEAKAKAVARTGVDLSLVEPSKAAELREDIKKSALDRQGLIDIKRVAELLSVSTGTVWALISTEGIPQPLHIGRSTRWRENEILAWIEEGCPTRERWELTRKAAVRDYEVARRKR